ncbi:MAG: 30S ribosomal protein S17 [bacterium]
MEKTQEQKKGGRIFKGTVVSDKMKDTVVVKVESYQKHPKYGKFLRSQKKFKAHNPGNTVKVGDVVEIMECRPISKDKSFIVVK